MTLFDTCAIVVTEIMNTPSDSIRLFRQRMAIAGLAVAVLALVAGLVVLGIDLGNATGFIEPASASHAATSILGLASFILVGMGTFGFTAARITDQMLVRPAGVSEFRTKSTESKKLKSILRGILPPPPRGK